MDTQKDKKSVEGDELHNAMFQAPEADKMQPEKNTPIVADAAGTTSVGEASFEKKANSKLIFIVAVIAVIAIGALLLARSTGLLVSHAAYTNPINGYSYEYSEGLKLVADGNMPAELVAKNLTSMDALGFMSGDSLLVGNTGAKQNGEKGDNIVYTILDLSSRPSFVSFDDYTKALFTSLDQSKESGNLTYERKEGVVGDNIPSIEYSFEMAVPIDKDGHTRMGVFHDNIFQMPDGAAYSISFGYPKDIQNADMYVKIYRDLLKSFKPGTLDKPTTQETAGAASTTETNPAESAGTTSEATTTPKE